MTLDSLTDEQRAELETKLVMEAGLDIDWANDIIDPDRSTLRTGEGLELVLKPVDQPEWGDAHVWPSAGRRSVVRLPPADAREFDQAFVESYLLPMLYKALCDDGSGSLPGTPPHIQQSIQQRIQRLFRGGLGDGDDDDDDDDDPAGVLLR